MGSVPLNGLKETMRRTRVTRAQLRYAEEQGHLGAVSRGGDGRRLYSADQVRWLERLGALRELNLILEEAAGLASALCGRPATWSRPQAQALVERTLGDVE